MILKVLYLPTGFYRMNHQRLLCELLEPSDFRVTFGLSEVMFSVCLLELRSKYFKYYINDLDQSASQLIFIQILLIFVKIKDIGQRSRCQGQKVIFLHNLHTNKTEGKL